LAELGFIGLIGGEKNTLWGLLAELGRKEHILGVYWLN